MDNKPDKQSTEHPDNHVDPEHAPRGIPKDAGKDGTKEEATGWPGGRHETETAAGDS